MASNSDTSPKVVTVKEISSERIIVEDKNSVTRSISPITSGKGLPPAVGEVWIMVKVAGTWMLDSCVTPTSWVNPAGMVANFAGTHPPDGWVWCDGSSLPCRDYPDLYAAIGDAYGSPTGGASVSVYRSASAAPTAPASSLVLSSWSPASSDVAVVAVAIPSTAYVTSVAGNSFDWTLLKRETLGRLSFEVWSGTRQTAPTAGTVTVSLSTPTAAIAHGSLLTGVETGVLLSGKKIWAFGLQSTKSSQGAADDVPAVLVTPDADTSLALGWMCWLDPSVSVVDTYGTAYNTTSVGVGMGLAGAKMVALSQVASDPLSLGGSRFSNGAIVPWVVVGLTAVPGVPRSFVLPTVSGVGGHQAIIATGGSMLVPGP